MKLRLSRRIFAYFLNISVAVKFRADMNEYKMIHLVRIWMLVEIQASSELVGIDGLNQRSRM